MKLQTSVKPMEFGINFRVVRKNFDVSHYVKKEIYLKFEQFKREKNLPYWGALLFVDGIWG